MRKIKNPWAGDPDYLCYGCCPDNGIGLKMEFFEDGDEVVSLWNPSPHHIGEEGVVHGGVQSALIDEAAIWYVMVKLGTVGVTAELRVKYRKVLKMSGGEFAIRASFHNKRKNVYGIDVRIFDNSGVLCTDGRVTVFTVSPETAREGFGLPEKEAFFE
ncbi:MAG: hypothetical protein A2Y33_09990 [Spirochaetes bacterium GWF1_51_8]|nr:MAG: hypothetical protein A2Y33_09990 [Spirochaetes bacterium GWF1_51_8]